MRSVSILELCLLAFLCLSMNALQLSVRDMAFGIALGFGFMSANDFILASLISRNTSLTAPLQFVYESLILFSLGVWAATARFLSRPASPWFMPPIPPSIAGTRSPRRLGTPERKVAVQQPANSFFLTDVEKVVDKVLTRNLTGQRIEVVESRGFREQKKATASAVAFFL